MSSERALRRRAHAQGLKLVKYRQDSRWFGDYGPYALADQNGCLVAWGLDVEDVAMALAE
ncbi:hypothetical protein AU193_22315 [Mycobacterium sp. GA-1285]|nr:hypothetical protein AU193_22315 [Mycobacterium sp. GA-1285]